MVGRAKVSHARVADECVGWCGCRFQDELKQIISDVDTDGDGVISFDEFHALMTADGLSAKTYGTGTDQNEIRTFPLPHW